MRLCCLSWPQARSFLPPHSLSFTNKFADTPAHREMVYNQQMATALQSLCTSLFIVRPNFRLPPPVDDCKNIDVACNGIDDNSTALVQLESDKTELLQKIQMGV